MPKKTAQGSASSDNKPSLLQITITYSRQNIKKKRFEDTGTSTKDTPEEKLYPEGEKVTGSACPIYFVLMALCLRHTQGTTKILK